MRVAPYGLCGDEIAILDPAAIADDHLEVGMSRRECDNFGVDSYVGGVLHLFSMASPGVWLRVHGFQQIVFVLGCWRTILTSL